MNWVGDAIEPLRIMHPDFSSHVLVAGFGFYDAGVDMIQAQRTRKHVVGKCRNV
jgi:hypothetical protein